MFLAIHRDLWRLIAISSALQWLETLKSDKGANWPVSLPKRVRGAHRQSELCVEFYFLRVDSILSSLVFLRSACSV